jgi:long-subunit acyl-CoA synthetase (AMP-forming)
VDLANFIGRGAAVVAALLAIVAAGYSVRQVVSRRKAERDLLRELIRDEYFKQATENARDISQIREVGPYKSAVERIVRSLDEGEQRQIKEALNQPTEEGRRNYIWKLMKETAEEIKKEETNRTRPPGSTDGSSNRT